MLNERIQGSENRSCICAWPTVKRNVSLLMPAAPTGAGRIIQTVIANTIAVMNSENRFIGVGLVLGKKANAKAPKAGRNTISVSSTTKGLVIVKIANALERTGKPG